MDNSKTGIRTGASPVKGSNKPMNFLMVILEKLKNLSPRQKMFSAIGIAGIVLVVLLVNVFINAGIYVPLYNNPLTSQDATAISSRLNEMRITHEITANGTMITVPPSGKSKLQMQLAFYGLPHRAVVQPESGKDSGFAPKTTQEIGDMQRQKLEGDLILAIREIDGIADANVKISLPDRDRLFEQGSAKASVMLRLQPGINLTSDKIDAISHFIASSVPDLNQENVKIIDTNGRFYKASNPKSEVGQLAPADQEELVAYKDKFESEKVDKIREVLDPVLGADKYTVSVDAEIDFGQTETKTITHGGPANTAGSVTSAETTQEETFTNEPNSSSGSEQISIDKFSNAKGATNYSKKSVNKKQNVDSREERKVNTAPGIARLTASVAVDGLKQDQVANVKGLVEGAIGFNESRGDSIKVISMPFSSDVMQKMREELISRPAVIPKSTTGSPISQWFLAIALIPVVLLIAVAAYLFMKEKELGLQKGFTNSQTATSLDMAQKTEIGNATALKLELLAKEKPTRVAELLKSTWLADKER